MPSVFSLANSIIFAESEPEKLVQGFLSATAIDVQEIESRYAYQCHAIASS
ncbi:MAG: hypothetical protein AB3A66_21410 [Nodularia sp. CChRGM 3473]